MVLSAVISRREFVPGKFNDQPLSFCFQQLKLDSTWEHWQTRIQESQDRLKEMEETDVDREICSDMRLLVPVGVELDSTHFRIFRTNGSYLRDLPPVERYQERIRFFRVGECIRLMYNTIRLSGEHDELNYLMRKVFLRMRYILFESFSEQFSAGSAFVKSDIVAAAAYGDEGNDEEAAALL